MSNLSYWSRFFETPEGGYTVDIPDLPGFVTEGDSFDNAYAMALDAVFGWLELAGRGHEEIPRPSAAPEVLAAEAYDGAPPPFLVRIPANLSYDKIEGALSGTIKIDQSLVGELTKLAYEHDISVDDFVKQALRRHLKVSQADRPTSGDM